MDTMNATGNFTDNDHTPSVIAMLASFSVVGTVGNLLVIVVTSRSRDRRTTKANFFIAVLACVDIVSCLAVIPLTIYDILTDYSIVQDTLCKAYIFLGTSTIPLSAYLMVVIAVERYLCICKPFSNCLTATRSRLLIAALVMFVAVQGSLVAMLNGTWAYATINGTNITVFENTDCDMHHIVFNEDFSIVVKYFHLSTYWAAVLSVAVLYILVYRFILGRKRQKEKRLETTRQAHAAIEQSLLTASRGASLAQGGGVAMHRRSSACSEAPTTAFEASSTANGTAHRKRLVQSASVKRTLHDMKIAIMLSIVAVVFVVCYMPAALILYGAVPFNDLLFYAYFAMNMVNPIIYSFMNPKFRSELKQLCKSVSRTR